MPFSATLFFAITPFAISPLPPLLLSLIFRFSLSLMLLTSPFHCRHHFDYYFH
jgi:hypothetical protein